MSLGKMLNFWDIFLCSSHNSKFLIMRFRSVSGDILHRTVAGPLNTVSPTGEDRRVHIWDLGSGSLVKELRGHTDTVYSLAFSHCNKMVASGGLDCVLRCWDVRHGAEAGASSL